MFKDFIVYYQKRNRKGLSTVAEETLKTYGGTGDNDVNPMLSYSGYEGDLSRQNWDIMLGVEAAYLYGRFTKGLGNIC